MDNRRALLVDAFTAEPLSSNTTGIVPDADGLDAEQMHALIAELSASETAFVCSSTAMDRRTRYFTPQQEVDFCDHATIATHAHFTARRDLEPGTHTLGTNVGTLDIELGDPGEVWMMQDAPTVRPLEVGYDRLAVALGIDDAALRDVGADPPVAIVPTGLPFLVVPISFLKHLSATDPDDAAIAGLAAEHDAAGFYAYTFDTIDGDSTLHTRCFAPGIGTSEDPATRTAAGACGTYLRQIGAFDSMPDELQSEQGHFMDRPGTVRVRVDAEIRVGDRVVQSFDDEVVVPEFADDDIIEA